MTDDDHGSTLPLILGFFLLALIMVAGSIAAGDAFVQQRDLQDVCDGAVTAAAASGVDLGRGGALGGESSLQFGDVHRYTQSVQTRGQEFKRSGEILLCSCSPDLLTSCQRPVDKPAEVDDGDQADGKAIQEAVKAEMSARSAS